MLIPTPTLSMNLGLPQGSVGVGCVESPGKSVAEDRRGAIFERITTLDARLETYEEAARPGDDASESGFESMATGKDDESDHSSMGSTKLRLHAEFLQFRAMEREKAAREAEAAAITAANLAVLRDPSRLARRLNDDTVLDGAEFVRTLGRPDARQKHSLSLRSAYESYSAGGEPLFTQSMPGEGDIAGVACVDYIFYSGHQMVVQDVLSLPQLNQLRGDNPQANMTHADPYWVQPPEYCSSLFNRHVDLFRQVLGAKAAAAAASASVSAVPSKQHVEEAKRLLHVALQRSLLAGGTVDPVAGKEADPGMKVKEKPPTDALWGGVWVPNATYNPRRSHSWLPNDVFVSSHMAMGARLNFIEGAVAAMWR